MFRRGMHFGTITTSMEWRMERVHTHRFGILSDNPDHSCTLLSLGRVWPPKM